MTSPTPTPPCLGEREAVARTLVDAFEEAVRQEVREARLMCGAGPVPAVDQRKLCRTGLDQHLFALRTENETLRAERDAAIARAEEAGNATDRVRQAMIAKFDTATRLATERYYQIATLRVELAQAKAQAAGCRDALKPFAEAWAITDSIGEQGGGFVQDDGDAWVSGGANGNSYPMFKFGDLRRAHTLVAMEKTNAD